MWQFTTAHELRGYPFGQSACEVVSPSPPLVQEAILKCTCPPTRLLSISCNWALWIRLIEDIPKSSNLLVQSAPWKGTFIPKSKIRLTVYTEYLNHHASPTPQTSITHSWRLCACDHCATDGLQMMLSLLPTNGRKVESYVVLPSHDHHLLLY